VAHVCRASWSRIRGTSRSRMAACHCKWILVAEASRSRLHIESPNARLDRLVVRGLARPVPNTRFARNLPKCLLHPLSRPQQALPNSLCNSMFHQISNRHSTQCFCTAHLHKGARMVVAQQVPQHTGGRWVRSVLTIAKLKRRRPPPHPPSPAPTPVLVHRLPDPRNSPSPPPSTATTVKQVKCAGCGFRNTENSARRILFQCTGKQRAATQFSSLPGQNRRRHMGPVGVVLHVGRGSVDLNVAG
jgi:hypothetical protein